MHGALAGDSPFGQVGTSPPVWVIQGSRPSCVQAVRRSGQNCWTMAIGPPETGQHDGGVCPACRATKGLAVSGTAILLWELLGTGVMVLLGSSVVANVTLARSYGEGSGWLAIALGWGFGVFAGASIAAPTGGHVNPAVTLGLALRGATPWPDVPWYVVGQGAGAFIGAVVAWAAYKLQFDHNEDNSTTRGVFCTSPVVRSLGWNALTEAVATFVLVVYVLAGPSDNSALGYAAVAFVVIGIGCSLGGPTGYAINPARDLGPRVAYAVLPIPGKAGPDWSYALVPVFAPVVGAVAAAAVVAAMPVVG